MNLDYSRVKTLRPTLDPPPLPSINGGKAVAHVLELKMDIGIIYE
jgi:hypothetical protein